MVRYSSEVPRQVLTGSLDDHRVLVTCILRWTVFTKRMPVFVSGDLHDGVMPELTKYLG